MQNLSNILKNIPKLPWVYQYFNSSQKIIYIWKSVNLHSRVNSYFNGKSTLNFAKKKMVDEIENIEIIITNTAIESLLLETTLIKKHKPKYNILMKDDKNHTYIKITDEIFPKIVKSRVKKPSNCPLSGGEPKNSSLDKGRLGGVYFGPYISSNYVNNIIKVTKKIFGHRSCNIVFESSFSNTSLSEEGKGERIKTTNWSKIPCIDYYIWRCAAPCLLKEENIKNYNESIKNIKNFLSWDFGKVIEDLKIKMKDYAEKLEFEKAKELKEDILSIESLNQNQIVRDIIGFDADIINFLEKYDKFYISKIEVRNEKITWIYNFEIEDKLQDLEESIKYFIENNYLENSKKLTLILPKKIDLDKEILEELKLKIEIPKIWEKTDILNLAYKNAFEFAYKKHLEWLSVKGFTKKDMQDLLLILWYKQINKDIIFECNDISHISGNYTVASRSIIENWKINTSKYKKFKIRTLQVWEINDFDSMREIMKRRLLEIEKTWFVPDLIIIDGWKWQLSSIVEVVEKEKRKTPPNLPLSGEETNSPPNFPLSGEETSPHLSGEWLNSPPDKGELEGVSYFNFLNSLQLVSLAKKQEELFLPWEKESIFIDKESNILRMIQKIRDEAHRFAITFNRDSRIKASKKNILEELPWIWPKTRSKLLKHYWSINDIKNDDELKNILKKSQIETLENHGII